MAYEKAYANHVEKLVKCLPMDDALFITSLCAHQLLPGDTRGKIESKATQTEKALYFLTHVIKPALDIKKTESFQKLLSIMQDCGYDHVQSLSSEIKCEIDKVNETKTDISDKSSIVAMDRETLRDDLKDSVNIDELTDENVVGAFTYLFRKLVIIFSKVDFTELKSVCMLRGAPLPLKFKQKIKAAKELDDILDVLDNPMYCNWLNVRLLKRVAKNIDNQQAVKLIEVYEKNVYSRKVSGVKKYFSICFDEKAMTSIEVEINKSHEDLTVKQIIDYSEELENSLDIYTGAASIADSNPGCLKITIVIPVHCLLHAFNMAKKNILKLRQFHIQYLEIESYPKVFALNYRDKETAAVLLPSSIFKFSNPNGVIKYYYAYLERYMDADSVSHMMHYKHLITDDDYKAITAAPIDIKMNTVILQYVKAMDANLFMRFCDVLKNIESQKFIGDSLSTSLKSVNVKSSRVQSITDTGFMNISLKLQLKFLDLLDKFIAMMSTADIIKLTIVCEKLMASNRGQISLFNSDFIQRLRNNPYPFIFKMYLLPFMSWFDHSILSELVKSSRSKEAIQLLKEFDTRIDYGQPITSNTISELSQLIIPYKGTESEYTLLVTKYFKNRNEIMLRDLLNIKRALTLEWEITDHAIQAVAMHSRLSYFYWLIPRNMQPLIEEKLTQDQLTLWNEGIIMMNLLPNSYWSDDQHGVGDKFNLMNFSVEDTPKEDLRDHQIAVLIKKNQEVSNHIKMLSNENSDYESTLKMKQTKIDEQKKQLKLINASYAELKYKQSKTESVVKQSYSDNLDKSSPVIDIHQLMNVVPLIQEKWSDIGTMLKFSTNELNKFCHTADKHQISFQSRNTFCCIQMLKQWLKESDNASVDVLINAIDVPYIGLCNKVSRIKTILTSEYLATSVNTEEVTTNPPEKFEQPYIDMKAKFCLALTNSRFTVSDMLVYVNLCNIKSEIFEKITDYISLIKALEEHDLAGKTDLSWLKYIATCSNCLKATEIIEEYESLLFSDKVIWSTVHLKGTYLVGKISKSSEFITIKDISNAKSAASRIVNLEETDSKLDSSEVESVIFYWRVIKDVSINIPNFITASVKKQCIDAHLTHVGVMMDRKLNLKCIDEFAVTGLKRYKDNLKHCYRKRIDQKKSTRWPAKLGDPTLYVDVTIIRAKFLSERFREEHAMGLVKRSDHSYVTVDELLRDGYGKVILIEGDPGAGKTTFAFQICKDWAEDKLLMEDIVFWIPLRHYKSATVTSELFDKLGYPEMMEYAQQQDGKGLVLILDGWDELPNHLQTSSLFHDIIFGTIRTFTQSTIIVTSRPSCSGEIAEAVEETNSYYQILGFDQKKAVTYIKAYFHDDSSSAELLLAFLNSNYYLYQHFYIPISVVIMCFVYRSDGNESPQRVSRLYERFVVLCLRSNVPNTCLQDLAKFTTIHNIPETMKPVFDQLCKKAFDMLKDNKLVLNEEEVEVMQDGMDHLQLNHFDGFGLLHVDHYTSTLATIETSYSFIHRAVQELLAAIFILDTGNISDILDEYFNKDSYLINMFPFLFGLVSKELLRPLAGKLIQIFNKSHRSRKLLSSILYCLFEAHDETLCREFGQVFSKKRDIKLNLGTLLECHYAFYFIAVCGMKKLNVTMECGTNITNADLCCEIITQYLLNTSTDISSFDFRAFTSDLSHKGMKHFAKALSTQPNILSVKLSTYVCELSILCDSICKNNTQITHLELIIVELSEKSFDSIGSLLSTLPLKSLKFEIQYLFSASECLDSLSLFYKGLCETKSLLSLYFSMTWSQADKVFGNIISQNCSLKELCIRVATADCLEPILNGLSSNTSITTFKAWPRVSGTSNVLGQCLMKCFNLNHSLSIVDFTSSRNYYVWMISYVSWSSTQVCSICTGLCANTTCTVVTLDISGCYIDTEACNAVCGMLSQNTTLQHLFLNPVHLEKPEAIAMIDSCRANATLELLSLVQWPPKGRKDPFQYSCDPEINHMLLKIQKLRQEKNEPLLNVHWEYREYVEVKKQILPPEWL